MKKQFPPSENPRPAPDVPRAFGAWSLVLLWSLVLGAWSFSYSADWPTHMANNQRTGVTAEQLADASLVQKWAFTSPAPPQTAWFRQMRYDGSNAANGEKSQRAYDSAFNV